jgi:SprT-like family protein
VQGGSNLVRLFFQMPFKNSRSLCNWYKKYNKLYFDDRLTKDVLVGWNTDWPEDSDHCATHSGIRFTEEEDGAEHHSELIQLDPKQHIGARDERLSLLHEMCHVALFPNSTHGKKFKNEKRRVAMLGALDDLW